jgi:VanZ family protein
MLLLTTLLNVKTTEFYKTFDKVGHFATYFFIALFALMLLYATVTYVKR